MTELSPLSDDITSSRSPFNSGKPQKENSPPRSLKDDDDAFVAIAVALLERHRSRSLSIQHSVDSVLLAHERRAFWEALHFRKAQLPIFPSASESSVNSLVRDVEKLFGKTLSNSTEMSSPARPPEVTTTSGDPFLSDRSTASQGASTVRASSRSDVASHHSVPSSAKIPSTIPQPHHQSGLQPQHQQIPTMHSPQLDPIAESRSLPSPPMSSAPRHQPPGYTQQQFSSSQAMPQQQIPWTLPPQQAMPEQQIPRTMPPQQYSSSQAMPQQQIPRTMPPQQYSSSQAMPQQHIPQTMIPQQHYPANQTHLRRDPSPDNLHQDSSSSSPQLMSTTGSVDTERMQNIRHTYQPQKQNIYNQRRQPPLQQQLPPRYEHFNQYSSSQPAYKPQNHQQHQYHQQRRQETRERAAPANEPLYKQYRPPQLNIEAPPVETAPPPQIDIDWNIPVNIINEQEPVREKKTIRFEDSVLEKKRVQSENEPKQQKLDSPKQQQSPGEKSPPSPVLKKTASPKRTEDKNETKSSPRTSSEAPSVGRAVKMDYRMDIARNKSMLVLNEDEAVSKQTDARKKKLLNEIDRVTALLGNTVLDSDAQKAYEVYLTELRVELEKWNESSDFGSQKESHDSLLGTLEIERKGSDRLSTVGSKTRYDAIEEDRNAKRGMTQIKASDQFPDVRKQWRTVNVMAPYTLPEGFEFEARVGDEIFMATVPRGGVTKGQLFATRMGDIHGGSETAAPRTRVFRDMDAPPTRWRDEMFDCFRHGLFHPFLWNTIFCPHMALSQIMARIQISDTADPVITIKSRTRVWWYLLFTSFVFAVHGLYGAYFVIAVPSQEALIMATCPLVGMDLILLCYFFYLVIKTRSTVRREYDILELRCHGHEDCCMSVFCTCCTITQMGRHTADYETFVSYCCTDTGLANHIEVKLPSEYMDDPEVGKMTDHRDAYSLM